MCILKVEIFFRLNFLKMVKLNQLVFLFISIYFIIVLNSCQSGANKTANSIETQVLYENFITVENSGVNYKIPSPMEMFIFMNRTGSPFLNYKTHKVEKCNDYLSTKSKAINFGIYTADLAYCAVFGDFQQTIIYFNTSRLLANSLGLYEGYGAKIAERIDKNITSIDSLLEISADSYYLTNQFLEEQGSDDVLALILVGGWIEGLYLAIESVNGIDMDNPIVERIADQQLLLEGLLGYLRNNESSKNITEVIQELEQLQEVFDELYFNDENTIITVNQFVNISNEVISLRNSYIK